MKRGKSHENADEDQSSGACTPPRPPPPEHVEETERPLGREGNGSAKVQLLRWYAGRDPQTQ